MINKLYAVMAKILLPLNGSMQHQLCLMNSFASTCCVGMDANDLRCSSQALSIKHLPPLGVAPLLAPPLPLPTTGARQPCLLNTILREYHQASNFSFIIIRTHRRLCYLRHQREEHCDGTTQLSARDRGRGSGVTQCRPRILRQATHDLA